MPTQAQIDAANEQLAQINKQVEDGLTALNQIKLEQQGVQAGIDRLNALKDHAQKTLDDVNSSLDAATAARAAVLTEKADLESKLNAAHADLQNTLSANDKAKTDGAAQTQEIADAQAQLVTDAKAQLATAQAQKDDVEKQIAPLADQVARLTKQVADLNAQIISLNTQISTATQTLTDLNQKQSEAQQNLADLQSKSDALTTEITTKTAQSTSLDTDIATKTSQIADLEQKIKDIQAELEKNQLTNVDFLKQRKIVVDLQLKYQQLLDNLKQKYGELGEQWDG